MLYRLDLPALPAKVVDPVLDRWEVEVGAPVRFGQPLCRVRVAKQRLAKVWGVWQPVAGESTTPSQVLRRLRGRLGRDPAGGPGGSETDRLTVGTGHNLVLLAAEDGFLRRTDVGPGDAIEVGGRLAILSSDADESLDGDPVVAFRVDKEKSEHDVGRVRVEDRPGWLKSLDKASKRAKLITTPVKTMAKVRTRLAPKRPDRGSRTTEHRGRGFIVVRNRDHPDPIRGIYLFGGCDLPAVLHAAPLLGTATDRSWAVLRATKNLAVTRSDRQLALLDGTPPDAAELIERLRLPDDYFEPRLFEPTFRLPNRRFGEIDKDIVVLSGAADMIRPLYARRTTGTLVDPGAGWLQSGMEWARTDEDMQNWFRSEFKPVKRRTTDQIRADITRLTQEIRSRARAGAILIQNTLTVEPNDTTHNFQLRPKAEVIRRRQFLLALDDVSRADPLVRIIDVDRTLKSAGVDEQLDFAHFPDERNPEIAADVYQLLRDTGLA